MYPIFRMIKGYALARNAKVLGQSDTHISHHICWPWDLDVWLELNNGRTLTLYDLGRVPFLYRTRVIDMLRREKWAMTMAGASVRWRARIRAFERVEMQTKLAGWDARFLYFDQSLWKGNGRCAGQILYRAAVTDADGIVSTDRFAGAMGWNPQSPKLSNWVNAWITAEAERPWPPERSETNDNAAMTR